MKILKKLNQESTWRGLVAVVSAFGIVISPELAEHIVAGALGIVGVINIIKKD